jgi:AcrR family transcriptional regulator
MTRKDSEKDNASARRAAIVKAATDIMRDEGYAAVTSRKIAERAGLKSKLVHYYFKSMDELFLSIYRTGGEQYHKRQALALASANPLRGLWELNADSFNTRVLQELIALANHHEPLRDEIARESKRSRLLQAETFEKAMSKFPATMPQLAPEFLSLLLTAAARLISMDRALGVKVGHAEAKAWISQLLDQIEQA